MSHYDSSFLTAQYDERLDAVVMKWHDFAEGDDFREGLDAGLELIQEKEASNWLADLRKMGTVSGDDQEWSNNDWFPRAMETALTHMAIVQPENVVADMSVENIMQEVGDGDITTHHFDNRPEAERWLEQQT
jgi:hypothetical protein